MSAKIPEERAGRLIYDVADAESGEAARDLILAFALNAQFGEGAG